MNLVLGVAADLEYQVVYNVHLDDFYDPERFTLQRRYLQDCDVVSSEFQEVTDEDVSHISNC